MNHKSIAFVAVLILSVVATGMMAPAVFADESDEPEEVDVGVGESLSVAVQTAAQNIENDVDNVALEHALTNAESEQERADIVGEKLNESSADAAELRDEYADVVDSYENGEIGKSEMAREIAVISDDAQNVKDNLQDLEKTREQIPDEAMNNSGIDKEDFNAAENDLEIAGSDTAQAVGEGMVTPGMSVGVNADSRGIDVAVNASGERVFRGIQNEKPKHGEFELSEGDAIEQATYELPGDPQDFDVAEVKEDAQGSYEVVFEHSEADEVVEIVIDAVDGGFVGMSEVRGPPEHVPEHAGPPESVFGGDGGPGAGPGADDTDRDDQIPEERAGDNDIDETGDVDKDYQELLEQYEELQMVKDRLEEEYEEGDLTREQYEDQKSGIDDEIAVVEEELEEQGINIEDYESNDENNSPEGPP